MKYIMAIAVLALLTACDVLENGPSYGRNPDPALIYAMGGGMRPWTPPPQQQVTCVRSGTITNCF